MASAVVVALVVGLGVGWRLTGGHARAAALAGGPSCPKGPVTLTFDDGPDPVNTPQVLDLLKRYGVTATFFVIGSKAATYPDLIRREAQEGHRIENHSWDHPHLPTLSADDIRTQLFGTSTAIESAGAPPPVLFRPPFGETSPVVNRIANELGMQVIRWTTDSNDWRGNSPAQITEAVLGHLRAHVSCSPMTGCARRRTRSLPYRRSSPGSGRRGIAPRQRRSRRSQCRRSKANEQSTV